MPPIKQAGERRPLVGAYVEQQLVPVLKQGGIVIMDDPILAATSRRNSAA